MKNNVVSLADHARASSSLRARTKRSRRAKSAKRSSVISETLRDEANATTAAQWPAGMPRVFQPLTVESDCPSASASSPSAPGAVPLRLVMSESQSMPGMIVRALRTCQGFANRETTFLGTHGQIDPMDTDENVARRLIAVREHFTLSQVEFAEKLHIAKNTLNGFEQAKRPLTIETAKRIRDRFGVSTDWLLYGDIGQPSHSLAIALGPHPEIKKKIKKTKPPGRHRKVS